MSLPSSELFLGFYLGVVATTAFQNTFSVLGTWAYHAIQRCCLRSLVNTVSDPVIVPNVLDTFKSSYESSIFNNSFENEDKGTMQREPTDQEILQEAVEALLALRQATVEASQAVDDIRGMQEHSKQS